MRSLERDPVPFHGDVLLRIEQLILEDAAVVENDALRGDIVLVADAQDARKSKLARLLQSLSKYPRRQAAVSRGRANGVANVPAEVQQIVGQFELQAEYANKAVTVETEVEILLDISLRQVLPHMPVLHPEEPGVVFLVAGVTDARVSGQLAFLIERQHVVPIVGSWHT